MGFVVFNPAKYAVPLTAGTEDRPIMAAQVWDNFNYGPDPFQTERYMYYERYANRLPYAADGPINPSYVMHEGAMPHIGMPEANIADTAIPDTAIPHAIAPEVISHETTTGIATDHPATRSIGEQEIDDMLAVPTQKPRAIRPRQSRKSIAKNFNVTILQSKPEHLTVNFRFGALKLAKTFTKVQRTRPNATQPLTTTDVANFVKNSWKPLRGICVGFGRVSDNNYPVFSLGASETIYNLIGMKRGNGSGAPGLPSSEYIVEPYFTFKDNSPSGMSWCMTEEGRLFGARARNYGEDEIRVLLDNSIRGIKFLNDQGYAIGDPKEVMIYAAEGECKKTSSIRMLSTRIVNTGNMLKIADLLPEKREFYIKNQMQLLADILSKVGIFYEDPNAVTMTYTYQSVSEDRRSAAFYQVYMSPESFDFISRLEGKHGQVGDIADLLKHPFILGTKMPTTTETPATSDEYGVSDYADNADDYAVDEPAAEPSADIFKAEWISPYSFSRLWNNFRGSN